MSIKDTDSNKTQTRQATIVVTIPDVTHGDVIVTRRATVQRIDSERSHVRFQTTALISGKSLREAYIERADFDSGDERIPAELGRISIRETFAGTPLPVVGHIEYDREHERPEIRFINRLATATRRIFKRI